MDITPAQVAYRGFQCDLSNERILNSIQRALNAGRVNRPPFTRWPGGEPISVHIGESHLANWRQQFEEGANVEIPAEMTEELNEILGMVPS
ncbi:MAG: hypothetical protein OXU79_20595 [Gemmatimonadota bacterium]|nr:hypothetical protein [Gemmatimonadota bacterium]